MNNFEQASNIFMMVTFIQDNSPELAPHELSKHLCSNYRDDVSSDELSIVTELYRNEPVLIEDIQKMLTTK